MDGSRGGGDLGSDVLSLFHRGRLELAIAPSTVRVARHWTARLLSGPVSTSGQALLAHVRSLNRLSLTYAAWFAFHIGIPRGLRRFTGGRFRSD